MPSPRGVGVGNHSGVPSLSVISPITSTRKVRSSSHAGSVFLTTSKFKSPRRARTDHANVALIDRGGRRYADRDLPHRHRRRIARDATAPGGAFCTLMASTEGDVREVVIRIVAAIVAQLHGQRQRRRCWSG